LAPRAGERLRPEHGVVTTALGFQGRKRHNEDAPTDEAIAAQPVAMRLELAERVEGDLLHGAQRLKIDSSK